jgi:hypothetical protein
MLEMTWFVPEWPERFTIPRIITNFLKYQCPMRTDGASNGERVQAESPKPNAPPTHKRLERKVLDKGISVFGFGPGTFLVKPLPRRFSNPHSRPEIAGSAHFGKSGGIQELEVVR